MTESNPHVHMFNTSEEAKAHITECDAQTLSPDERFQLVHEAIARTLGVEQRDLGEGELAWDLMSFSLRYVITMAMSVGAEEVLQNCVQMLKIFYRWHYLGSDEILAGLSSREERTAFWKNVAADAPETEV